MGPASAPTRLDLNSPPSLGISLFPTPIHREVDAPIRAGMPTPVISEMFRVNPATYGIAGAGEVRGTRETPVPGRATAVLHSVDTARGSGGDAHRPAATGAPLSTGHRYRRGGGREDATASAIERGPGPEAERILSLRHDDGRDPGGRVDEADR